MNPHPNPPPQAGEGAHRPLGFTFANAEKPYSSSFNLYRMILPEPVRGIVSMRCTALGTL